MENMIPENKVAHICIASVRKQDEDSKMGFGAEVWTPGSEGRNLVRVYSLYRADVTRRAALIEVLEQVLTEIDEDGIKLIIVRGTMPQLLRKTELERKLGLYCRAGLVFSKIVRMPEDCVQLAVDALNRKQDVITNI
ncbi:hypothetical protein CEF21_15020 [Bacillus sp. FJAT-42376]|uniref:hypothetical protein n=1 Tax=Bacillus sp. FJAT-42376 TaxID=2014076 RepID=UPI000F50883A|nr:hypothetical protein [Bacillus sp. FJAT-42376]AZB43507.1 hypothetical protein CEF21_15020 [Bacillus sp. FJAT-42376]